MYKLKKSKTQRRGIGKEKGKVKGKKKGKGKGKEKGKQKGKEKKGGKYVYMLHTYIYIYICIEGLPKMIFWTNW